MTEGMKFDNEKPRTDLLPAMPLLEIAGVLGYGAQKYEAHNWRKGILFSRVYGALMRHLLAFWDGEDLDPESGMHHLAHAGCELMFLLEFANKPQYLGFDDRYSVLGTGLKDTVYVGTDYVDKPGYIGDPPLDAVPDPIEPGDVIPMSKQATVSDAGGEVEEEYADPDLSSDEPEDTPNAPSKFGSMFGRK